MKKFRLKIDTPWMPNQIVISTDALGNFYHSGTGKEFSPSYYPHLFEPIEEKSEVERVVEWLGRVVGYERPQAYHNKLAQKLISAGIDVAKLEVVE